MSAEAYLDTVLDLWAEGHHRSTSTISGQSMAPFLRAGDRITIEHGIPRARTGDIVVFRKGAKLVAHRVVGHLGRNDARSVLTKGDNSAALDDPVDGRQLVGRVVAIERDAEPVRLDSRWSAVVAYALALASRGSVTDPHPAPLTLTVMRVLLRLRRGLLPRSLPLRRLAFRALCGSACFRSRPRAHRPTTRREA